MIYYNVFGWPQDLMTTAINQIVYDTVSIQDFFFWSVITCIRLVNLLRKATVLLLGTEAPTHQRF